MQVRWMGRRVAAFSLAAAAAVAFVGTGTAQASPVTGSKVVISSGRSVPATSCSGKKVIIDSWKSGKSSYKPGVKVVVRGVLQNCTKGTVGVTFKTKVVAPCGTDNVAPAKGRLTAHQKRGVGLSIPSLPGSSGGKSCKGTWKATATVTSAGKTLATKTTSFKES